MEKAVSSFPFFRHLGYKVSFLLYVMILIVIFTILSVPFILDLHIKYLESLLATATVSAAMDETGISPETPYAQYSRLLHNHNLLPVEQKNLLFSEN